MGDDFTKGLGAKIAIKFSEALIGDVTTNKDAFTISGKQQKHIGGELIDGDYQISQVVRYPVDRIWADDLAGGLVLRLPNKIYPVADTYAAQTAANTNYGASGQLVVLGYAAYYTRAYMKFDTPVAPISKAELFMYLYDNDISDRKQNHHVKRITENWDEYLLTYNNAPSFYGEGSLSTGSYGTLVHTASKAIEVWRKADITRLLQEWQDGSHTNYGFVLDHNYNASYGGGVWASMKYRSKDYADADFRPYVMLTYSSNPNVIFAANGERLVNIALDSGSFRINWVSYEPDGTNIKIKIATGTVLGDFIQVTNGQVIDVNTNLWIKEILWASDNDKTPVLKELWIEKTTAPQNQILITMHNYKRFNNAKGNLTVKYDMGKGDLKGQGGYVESFGADFIPEDLIPLPNPMVKDKYVISAGAEVTFTKVNYKKSYAKEKFVITSSATVDFIPIEEINP